MKEKNKKQGQITRKPRRFKKEINAKMRILSTKRLRKWF